MKQLPHLSKTAVAHAFRVARATLYLTPEKQARKDKALLAQVFAVMDEYRYYGHRRIAWELGVSPNRIRRIFKKYGLKTKRRKRKPRSGSRGSPSGIPNLIKGRCPLWPNVFWAGDFPEFVYRGTIVYLATVIDLRTREIAGWSVGFHHSADLVIEALEDAVVHRERLPEIFHSDQGSEYASLRAQEWLRAHGIKPSHSKKASPWENGFKESWFGRYKEEMEPPNSCETIEKFIETIHHRIYTYNHKRIHTALKMPPRKFYEELTKRWDAIQKSLSTSVY